MCKIFAIEDIAASLSRLHLFIEFQECAHQFRFGTSDNSQLLLLSGPQILPPGSPEASSQLLERVCEIDQNCPFAPSAQVAPKTLAFRIETIAGISSPTAFELI